MAKEGRGTIFRRNDSKYLLYLPTRVVDDSMFPFKCGSSMHVRVIFKPGDNKIVIEKWKEKSSP